MIKKLWPHQERGLNELKKALVDLKKSDQPVRVILQSPTGSGKTVLAANIVRDELEKNNRICFVVDAISLIDQTVQSFDDEDISNLGVIQADHPLTDPTRPVQIASVQTLERRQLPETDVVIVDEAHCHYKIIKNWMAKCPNIVFIGLSATPWAKGLGKSYKKLVTVSTIRELIEIGVLCSFEVYAPSIPDLSKVGTRIGEFRQKELSDVMTRGTLIGDAVESWKKNGPDEKTLVFCVDRDHAMHIQDRFCKLGFKFEYVDAFTPRNERKEISKRFHRGKTIGVVSIGTMIKGIDWDVRCIVDCQPTKSEMRHVQKIGRGLRSTPGKSCCIILDHAGNHFGRRDSLGFVTDIHHDELHEFENTVRKNGDATSLLPEICSSCKYLKAAGIRKCPKCGFSPPITTDVETLEGELQKISESDLDRKSFSMNEKRIFYGQLKKYGMDRRYKPGWASNKFREKFGVWPNKFRTADLQQPTPEVLQWIQHQNALWIKSCRSRRN